MAANDTSLCVESVPSATPPPSCATALTTPPAMSSTSAPHTTRASHFAFATKPAAAITTTGDRRSIPLGTRAEMCAAGRVGISPTSTVWGDDVAASFVSG
eukprot:CAMPEP_0179470484 /NCGR_PEP_ID=MMETSP0799-20121207/50923_1 /TAXON_ID=46947 /ORGANISM="Geminigera cryophila, Strain CCMP2564" /LENGTH=99 /DNA_ID=CAMNT_0021277559 /DNA_START=142 /DNA_END=441 /DNA_ORIENTATION=+